MSNEIQALLAYSVVSCSIFNGGGVNWDPENWPIPFLNEDTVQNEWNVNCYRTANNLKINVNWFICRSVNLNLFNTCFCRENTGLVAAKQICYAD